MRPPCPARPRPNWSRSRTSGQAGLLWFELQAGAGGAILRAASWHATDTAPDPVGLGIVICTFNREAELARVLGAIAGHAGLGAVTRLIVVNQGRPGLLAHPGIAPPAALLGDRLRVVEQGNLGGAGGFGRGLLEALDDPDVTHACLLDDDVRLEPESLARMAAFFSLASRDLVLGGHMLDGVRPTFLYEAGAFVKHNWALIPLVAAEQEKVVDPIVGEQEPFICRSCRRVGWCEFSALLFRPLCVLCSTGGITSRLAAP